MMKEKRFYGYKKTYENGKQTQNQNKTILKMMKKNIIFVSYVIL